MTNLKRYFKKYFRYIKPYIPLSILGILLSTIITAGNTAPAWLVQYLIDDVLVGKKSKMLVLVCIGIVLVMFFKGLAMYYRTFVESYISGNMIRNIRTDLYNKLLSLSHEYFSESNTGDLMTRFNSDVPKARQVIQNVFKMLTELLTIVVLVIRLLLLNYKLALISFIIIPLSGWVMRKYIKKLRKTGRDIQESLSRFNNILQETVTGINVIKAFASENYEKNKFKQENDFNYKVNLKQEKINGRIRPVVELFNSLATVVIAFYGGSMVIQGKMSAGELMAFLVSLGLIYNPITLISRYNNSLQSDAAALDRVYEILNNETTLLEKENAKEMKKVKGDVFLNNISFSYKNSEKIIKNLTLKVRRGEMIALVGKSGSGKSTLVRLLPRFYDINEGEILIDGVDIRDLTFASLRKNIGIVPQETFLFAGTIKENIMYGKQDASIEEVINATKQANAYEFIKELPEGFETEIGERGVRLSGGQKQRLAIARAILEDPKILILDEATSALDTESEKIVQDALDRLMKHRTSFVIAHRLSTILNANKIVVMEDGEIKEIGTNEELLLKNGIYRKLYDTQFKSTRKGE